MQAKMTRMSSWAAVAAVAAVLVAAVQGADASTSPDERDEPAVAEEIPVEGQIMMSVSSDAGKGAVVGSVHGVRRISGGTVLYWSIGLPADLPTGNVYVPSLWSNIIPFDRYGTNGEPRDVSLVDVVGRKVYEPLVPAEDEPCLCSRFADVSTELGDVSVLYAVMPELPEEVSTVDVRLGFGAIVPDVPVSQGALEPAAPAQDRTILLGQPWPQIDPAVVEQAMDPNTAIYPLKTAVGSEDGSMLTETEPDEVTVNLAADVLFEFGEATLDRRATAVIRAAADQVNETGRPGAVLVVGHTDDVGSNSFNQTLSQQRAAAVAEVLEPLLSEGFAVEQSGRGEQEPTASNGTDEGRQLNRRVAITFEPQEVAP